MRHMLCLGRTGSLPLSVSVLWPSQRLMVRLFSSTASSAVGITEQPYLDEQQHWQGICNYPVSSPVGTLQCW